MELLFLSFPLVVALLCGAFTFVIILLWSNSKKGHVDSNHGGSKEDDPRSKFSITNANISSPSKITERANERECEGNTSCGPECCCINGEDGNSNSIKEFDIRIHTLFGSQSGTAKEWANNIAEYLKQNIIFDKMSNCVLKINVSDMSVAGFDLVEEELLVSSYMRENTRVIVIPLVIYSVSTYGEGHPPENCESFYTWLESHSLDFRVTKDSYKHVNYAVFGIGNSLYQSHGTFNTAAYKLESLMKTLTGHAPLTTTAAADNGGQPGSEINNTFDLWIPSLLSALNILIQSQSLSLSPFSSSTSSNAKANGEKKNSKTSEEPDEDPEQEGDGEPLVDVEDLGTMMNSNNKSKSKSKSKAKPQRKLNRESIKTPTKSTQSMEEEGELDGIEEDEESSDEEEETLSTSNNNTSVVRKDMLTPSLRKALTKQGYKLLGSHSGVKLCRWTKAMLRGRGGCYKHTFYGIVSYQCMEMTPSLACANKCVFCWRHHKNPVGTEWKWNVDEPEYLIEQAVANHHSLIKQLKGVPGVSKERFDEAFTIRHCALSLVGEPITYPHINTFLKLLHGKKISSFMVTNAQFPDKIDELDPVTQLYISVDAATKENLKRIDRPIFTDFWERFLSSIDALAKKGQRTVFRLTLVKDWNMEELKEYANLVARGKPSFVEVKGVTYCGTSKASSLTMKNVPFHQEVINFAKALCAAPQLQDEYELACEHEHSCGILIAQKKFKVNGVWNTWIDYPKFHQLVTSGKPFTATDYMGVTPSWAIYGAEEKGFDPEEIRFRRNKPYQNSGC